MDTTCFASIVNGCMGSLIQWALVISFMVSKTVAFSVATSAIGSVGVGD